MTAPQLYVLADLASDLGTNAVDACTVNNALNVAQLVALLVIIRWLRGAAAS